jgi:hypothetical protein
MRFALLALLSAVLLNSCGGRAGKAYPGNLLQAAKLREAVALDDAERLHDGVTPVHGDAWNTDLSAVFRSATGYADFDLGSTSPIDAAFLEGDNNDWFFLDVSDDGKQFREIWRAPPAAGPGMRPRLAQGLGASGRYLRLRARGGDAFVSVGELMVFAKTPAPWPPEVRQRRGGPVYAVVLQAAYVLGAALVLLLGCALRRVPIWATGLAALLSLAALAWWLRQVFAFWPLDFDLVCALRAWVGAVAVVAALVWTLGRVRARTAVAGAVLVLVGAIGVACFYNFGRPWFWNYAAGRPTAVHTYDMRVYFPVAKYFDELGFDGVYLASVKAYLDGEKLSPRSVEHVELRDLSTNQIVRAKQVMPQIEGVTQRFRPARWRMFVDDMRWFWRTMGPGDYLGSLRDHGGNATPVWLAIAHLMFRDAPADETTLTLAGALDPLLLALTFFCIARSFGIRAMLICLAVFGATDFPMFGSDWAGATLRFDWMATLGLACCALKTGRALLAGVLLAHAGLARAFPEIALAFAPIPFALFVIERRVRERAPLRKVFVEARGDTRAMLRMLGGALAATVLLVGLSAALFGFTRAWGGWLHKIEIHTETANTNHVGLRTVMAFDPDLTSTKVVRADLPEPWLPWQQSQLDTYERHKPIAWALRIAFCLLCLIACRGARPEHAALIGTLLIPVLTYPANYYCHYVFLLPLLAVGQRMWLGFFIELVLLAMCTLEYFTLRQAVDVRFFWESVILLAGFAAIIVPLAVLALRRTAASIDARTHAPVSRDIEAEEAAIGATTV